MKKSLLFISMLFAGATTGFAQKSMCTPDTSINKTSSTPNFLPDTSTVMVQTQGGTFNQTFTVYVPVNVEFLLPSQTPGNPPTKVTATLDAVTIDSISGIPAGFTLVKGSDTIQAGDIGCFTLSGTMPMTNDIMYHFGVYITPYGNLTGQMATFIQLAGGSPALPDALALAGGALPPVANYKVKVGNPVITPTVGIHDFSLNGAFNVNQNIPNPFDGSTTINFNAAGNGNIDFTVTDVLGRQVYDTNINATLGANTFVFTTDLANGTYFFSLSDGTNTVTKKMVVTK
jgi:Secretion system C-terminal sorting domain